MPIARVKTADGRVARFRVPDGTTPEQATALAKQHFAQQAKPAPKKPSYREAIGSTGLDQVNEFLIGIPQGLYNAASTVTDPLARMILGDKPVQQARQHRAKADEAVTGALVRNRAPVARMAGQIAGTIPLSGIKAPAALGKAAPAATRIIQGAIGGAATKEANSSGLPEAGIGAAANLVIPPLVSKIAASRPVQGAVRGIRDLIRPSVAPIAATADDAVRAFRPLPPPVQPPFSGSVSHSYTIPRPTPAQAPDITPPGMVSLIPEPRAPAPLAPLGRAASMRAARFRGAGVENPTTGMVTRDPRAWNFERETAKRYGAGDELVGQFKNVERDLIETGSRLVRSQGGARGAEASGLAVQKALDAKRNEMQQATGALYKRVRDGRGDVSAGTLNSLRDALDSPEMTDNPLFDTMREGVMRRLQRFGMAGQSGLLRNDSIASISQAEELRKMIGNLGPSNEPAVKMMRKQLIDAIDDDVVNTVGDDAFKAARASARKRFEEFSKTFAGKIADEGIPPEKLTQRLFGATSLSDLRALRQSLQTGSKGQVARGQAALRGLRAQALDDMLSGSVSPDGKLNGTKLFKDFEKNAPKLREILDPTDYKTLRRLVMASRDATAEVPYSFVNNSNTASAAANLFGDVKVPDQQGWFKLLLKHAGAFAAGGPAANVGLAVGESALKQRASHMLALQLNKQVQTASSPQAAAKAVAELERAARSNAAAAAVLKRWKDIAGNNPIIGGLFAGATKE